ncbi:MAG: hypothetical protein WCL34_05250 [Methylococcaceae bacterium]|jgi:hypothetical protein
MDTVKVPFHIEKKDGSKTLFLPDCRMKTGYEIGARDKDKEKHIQNYWDALNKLLAMNTPRFRRKNENGIFGTVTCNKGDIEEVRKDFIESERMKHGG